MYEPLTNLVAASLSTARATETIPTGNTSIESVIPTSSSALSV